MKKIYILFLGIVIGAFAKAQCPTFSISAPSGTVVGCNPNTVTLFANNTSTLAGVTYTWISMLTGTQTGTSINAGCPGPSNTFTVVASAPSSTCISSQVISVVASTLVPNMIVNPSTRTITCNGACASFTAVSLSGTANIIGTWYNPDSSPIAGPSLSPMIMCANAPGTYTAQFCSPISGCCTQQTVAVLGSTIIPTMTITPVTMNGFTINCTNPQVIMGIPTISTLAPIGYTWTPLANPSASTTPASGGYTATVPGQYQAAFHDGNFCYVSTTVNVSIDTLRPSPLSMTNLSSNSYTLSCFNPSLVATALTNPLLSPSSYSWTVPGPLTFPSNTIVVGLANVTSSTAPTTYTMSAMGPNGCIGKAKVNFYKNTYIPLYSVVNTPSAITCANPCVALSPSGTSTVPISFTITSPPPTQTATTSGALMCIPGTYTMTYINQLNGCSASTNTVVLNNAIPPSTFAVGPYLIPCGSTSVNITAGTNSLNPAYTFSWTGPAGASMNNPSGYFTSADKPGTYTVFINNFVSGCFTTNTVAVTQATALVVPINGLDTICLGYGTNLTTNVVGATSYSWNTGATSNLIYVTPTVTTVYSISVTNSVSGCSGSNTFTVNVKSCVGIEELQWSKNISISPNPNNGKFSVTISANIENAEIKIINAVGQEVYRQNVKQGKNEVNLGVLAKGIYYYSILQNKQPVNRAKILIE